MRKVDLYREQSNETERIYKLLETNYSSDGENFYELLKTRLMVLKFELKLEKAEKIKEAEKLGIQRKHFIQLSDNIIELVKTFEAPETSQGSSLYVQFCPMANDDKGAFWLSKEDEVKNPYYGDMMLNCGEVREEIE